MGDAYLYQCLAGIRDMNPANARRAEDLTGGELRRWSLCQKTWAAIWPELIGTEGAPELQAPDDTGPTADEARGVMV